MYKYPEHISKFKSSLALIINSGITAIETNCNYKSLKMISVWLTSKFINVAKNTYLDIIVSRNKRLKNKRLNI